ncbi:secondary thiamine-phosphate synthase enzyme YjbQ [Gymnodinialimonas sp. 2305UL16-5]|uniref:secondary thiamine-phosphate synthase enzyme YjbQ n=1 Tax=Gymnodinialimonas mytili TaxID=3126503 RepID=UPI0030A199B6
MQTEFEIATRGVGMYEVTREVAGWLPDGADGLLTLMVRHTSASLLIQENADPDVQVDLLGFLDRFVPRGMDWLTHVAEGPDDMPAHIKAAVLPVSVQIPVAAGRMRLGTWQGIYLVEHRDAQHRRRVAALFQAI